MRDCTLKGTESLLTKTLEEIAREGAQEMQKAMMKK